MHPTDLPARIAAKISVDSNGCWIWTAGKYGSGYGAASFGNRTQAAHRVTYKLLVGPIPDGLDLDHLCRVRACVNPQHVEPVTRQVNLLRGETIPASHIVKTHCPKGHEYTSENTRVYKGSRFCKQCHRDREREKYQRNPEKGAAIRKRNRLARVARLKESD